MASKQDSSAIDNTNNTNKNMTQTNTGPDPYTIVEQKLDNFKKHLTDSISKSDLKVDLPEIGALTLSILLSMVKAELANGKSPQDMGRYAPFLKYRKF